MIKAMMIEIFSLPSNQSFEVINKIGALPFDLTFDSNQLNDFFSFRRFTTYAISVTEYSAVVFLLMCRLLIRMRRSIYVSIYNDRLKIKPS